MNQGFRIRLERAGEPLPLSIPDKGGGLVLDGESDASPRDFFLEFSASSSVTALRMRHVQRIFGWHPWEFRLKRRLNPDGTLSFAGVEEGALPAGRYWIRPRLEDLTIGGGKRQFLRVEEDAFTEVVLEAKTDARRVELTRKVDDWDERVRRVIRSADSKIDGRAPGEWLEQAGARPRRKACLMNLLASLRCRNGKSLTLLDAVIELFHVEVDRIYTRVTADLFRSLVELAEDRSHPVYYEGTPTAKVHEKLLHRARDRFGIDPLDFKLESFRAEGGPSLQIVVGVPRGVAAEHFAEMDLDLGNPLQDVGGFVVHIGELLDSGRTDHLALRKKLDRSPTREFLYYRVAKG